MSDDLDIEKLGRYEIVRELGRGAMGVVYEGRDPNIGRRVAIKTARADVMEASGLAEEMMERFLREARSAGALNHPNIITIYDADEDQEQGVAYIAMEFIEGGTLEDLMTTRQAREFTAEKQVEMTAQICEALAVAHDHGIVHRDIKPGNVMTPKDGPLKVADFGIAHVSDSNLTQKDALIGTPHYMSPEQFMGQSIDGRSDLFSVGVMLYEMLTGEKPFTGEQLVTVMNRVTRGTPDRPIELNPMLSDPVSQVCMKALEKRPQDRYQNGRAMAAALRESLKANPDPAVLMGDTNDAAPAGHADVTVLQPGGPAASSADATVARGAAAELDATAPGGAPFDADATTPGQAPALDETKPGGGPAGSERKGEPTAKGVKPDFDQKLNTPASEKATVKDVDLPPEEAVDRDGKKPGMALYGGIAAAVLVVVAAVGGALSLGGGGEGGGAAPSPQASGESAYYFGEARFPIWQAPSFDVLDRTLYVKDGILDEKALQDAGFEQIRATLTLWDADTDELLKTYANYESNSAIEVPGRARKLRFEAVASNGATDEGTLTQAPDEANAFIRYPILLAPE